ncbi:TPA: restriction endonuclease subunit S [Citrobacter farmeri]|nr:restriction endonuclease subunit S [Citrobacter farmeri]HCD7631680.1 restriction endonuclease subunit S [Citrobacter farmeri]
MKTETVPYSIVASFTPGAHVSRIRQNDQAKACRFYATEQFMSDCWQLGNTINSDKEQVVRPTQAVLSVQTGDVVISLIHGKAAIVSPQHAGRLLSNNYVRVEVDSQKVIPEWFVWHFNESKESRRQQAMATQGSTCVLRLSLTEVRQFTATLPPLNKQKAIGGLYLATIEKRHYQQRLAALNEQQIMGQLSDMIQ